MKEIVFEIFGEGGSLTGYRSFNGFEKDKTPTYLFHWSSNGMGLEDNESYTMSSQEFMFDFESFWQSMVKKEPMLYHLTPKTIHSEYKIKIARDLRKKLLKGESIHNLENWAEVLDVSKYELTEEEYFDYDLILDRLTKFETKLHISNIDWNEMQLRNNDYNSIAEFRTVFEGEKALKNKIAGIYAYFNGNKCIYIGKSKDIKTRIESHWKTSQGLDNSTRGHKHRVLFGETKDELLSIYYLRVDDKFNSRIGEELRKIIENILHLKYRPIFERIKTPSKH